MVVILVIIFKPLSRKKRLTLANAQKAPEHPKGELKMFREILEVIGQVSNLAGAVGGVVAAAGVIKMLAAQKRQEESVVVALRLEGGEGTISLPLEMLRRDVSRAELLGRIGMLPMRQKGVRFSIRALATPAFMRAVNEVVEGRTSTLVIPATSGEIEQFDL